jgi:hypothetical protein
MGIASGQLSLLEQARIEHPDQRDERLLRRIAEETIRELAESPPIDLEVVAASRGIDDIRIENLDVAGSLTPEPEGLVMRLHRGDSRARQRFTGFHEVSHTFQPGYRDARQLRCNAHGLPGVGKPDKEVLSDLGAVELLMPEIYVSEDLAAADFGIETAESLSGRYESSVQASTYRLSSLWPEPTLVVVLEQGLRKEERGAEGAVARLRVLHAHPAGGRWPFVPRNKSAAEEGPLVRAFATDGEPVEGETSLDDLVGSGGPEGLEVSAKGFDYRRGDGTVRRRVIAIFRQPE